LALRSDDRYATFHALIFVIDRALAPVFDPVTLPYSSQRRTGNDDTGGMDTRMSRGMRRFRDVTARAAWMVLLIALGLTFRSAARAAESMPVEFVTPDGVVATRAAPERTPTPARW
jgi:hypothetical protein